MQEFTSGQNSSHQVSGVQHSSSTHAYLSAQPEVARKMQTVMGRLFIGSGGSLMIAVAPDEVGLDGRSLMLDGKEFAPKAEVHVTIASFRLGKEIEKILRDPAKKMEFDTLLQQLNGESGIPISFDTQSALIHIAKNYQEPASGAELIVRRESLIRAVACDRGREIVDRIGQFLGKEIPMPYLHLTLYTYGSDRGIAVPDLQTLELLRQRELPATAFEGLLQSRTRTVEGQIDRFLASVDLIRTAPKVEVDLSNRSKMQALGQQIIDALMSADPIDALGAAIQNPEVASVLRKVLDLRGAPQDPRHHPEGDVLVHTLMVVAQASKLCAERGVSAEDRKVVMLGALLHDVGKGESNITRRKPSGSGGECIVAYGHEIAGVRPARDILRSLDLLDCSPAVLSVVKNHMVLPARYREVQAGIMDRGRCVERTRQLIDRECYEFNPEVLLICTAADWLGRGTARTQAQRQAFFEGFSAVWQEAQQKI